MLTPHSPRQPGKQDIHLWQWELDTRLSAPESYWKSLSDDERRRAESYRFEKHRRRFVIARGQLRLILAAYLECTPERIVFEYGPAGKPYSLLQPEQWQLNFNLSHSEGTAALAVSAGFEIGIDVERIRPIEDDILPLIFSASERAQFDALSRPQRNTAFFHNWARKEACLKALGTGLQAPPTHFEFDLEDRDVALLRVAGDPAEAKHWQVRSFAALGHCAGAVAARNIGWSLLPMA
jgi:4'-phosphopantetheinyl transferase